MRPRHGDDRIPTPGTEAARRRDHARRRAKIANMVEARKRARDVDAVDEEAVGLVETTEE